MSQSIFDVQQALARKGFDPGNIDGVWGRRTENAVRAFQAKNRLSVDGIVGPVTRQKLFSSPVAYSASQDPSLVWFLEAKRLIGTKEVPGLRSSPTILDWAADLDISYPGDDIPWCGLFVAHCIGSTLSRESMPSIPLLARAWLKFGAPVSPRIGAVLVFWRGSKAASTGHVGFYAGETQNHYVVLGGNQSDSVNLVKISKDRLLGARWPATVPDLGTTTLLVSEDAAPDTVTEA
jgi:uncharacterized protein (TIGR02594 family)